VNLNDPINRPSLSIRRTVRPSELRAGDADREAVIDALQRHCADGRLSPDELEERIDIVYAAKTYGQLDVVLRDLPGGVAAPAPRGAVAAPPARGGFPLVPVLAVLAVMFSLAAMADGFFLPFWLLVFWAILASRRRHRPLRGSGPLRGPALSQPPRLGR